MPGANANAWPDAVGLKSLEVIPFTFWDDTVVAGHKYRYKVRVDYVNPVFQFKAGLANKELLTKGVLESPFSQEVEVKVNADVEFFVMTGLGARGDVASIRLFKHSGGKWYRNDITVPTGVRITGRVNRPEEGPVTVDTNLTIVDIQTLPTSDIRVILMDPEGNLSTRDSASDMRSRDMERLMNETRTAAAVTESQPNPNPGTAAPIAGTPARGTATTTPRGGPTPVPTTPRGGTPPR
jgi:hypothetical protein